MKMGKIRVIYIYILKICNISHFKKRKGLIYNELKVKRSNSWIKMPKNEASKKCKQTLTRLSSS